MFFLKDEQLRSIFGKRTTIIIKNGSIFIYYEKLSTLAHYKPLPHGSVSGWDVAIPV